MKSLHHHRNFDEARNEVLGLLRLTVAFGRPLRFDIVDLYLQFYKWNFECSYLCKVTGYEIL